MNRPKPAALSAALTQPRGAPHPELVDSMGFRCFVAVPGSQQAWELLRYGDLSGPIDLPDSLQPTGRSVALGLHNANSWTAL